MSLGPHSRALPRWTFSGPVLILASVCLGWVFPRIRATFYLLMHWTWLKGWRNRKELGSHSVTRKPTGWVLVWNQTFRNPCPSSLQDAVSLLSQNFSLSPLLIFFMVPELPQHQTVVRDSFFPSVLLSLHTPLNREAGSGIKALNPKTPCKPLSFPFGNHSTFCLRFVCTTKNLMGTWLPVPDKME